MVMVSGVVPPPVTAPVKVTMHAFLVLALYLASSSVSEKCRE